MVSPNAATDSQ